MCLPSMALAQPCRAHRGVVVCWVYKLKTRFEAEGEAAFEPRSRRPLSSPGALQAGTVDLITELRAKLAGASLDAGPETNAWHLEHHHEITASRSTISRT